MSILDLGRRRLLVVIASAGALVLVFNLLFLSGDDVASRVSHIPIPDHPQKTPATNTRLHLTQTSVVQDIPTPTPTASPEFVDSHPIAALMKEADQKWREYASSTSTTFRQTVEKYRRKYGRHPPPGFKEWYKYARKRNVFNIDDFDQIMDDLRPFWALEPKTIRTYAAHMWENEGDGISGIHIRNKKVAKLTFSNWRSDTLKTLIEKFVEYLPDMDIAMNRLDQPRLVVPWEDMQTLLALEYETRSLPPEAVDSFTTKQSLLADLKLRDPADDKSERLDPEWVGRPGKQYMDIASLACPPESPARSNLSIAEADAMYKSAYGGLVTNFNLSSDLCTIGPAVQNLHGFLYSSSSVMASKKLLPVFGECKVSVNNDILFPANMYWKHDERYDYSDKEDVPWEEKKDDMIWRGVTSGGVQIPENWSTMHRQRLVQLLNGTHMALEGKEVTVLTQPPTADDEVQQNATYENFHRFQPSLFADEHTDVGFVEAWGCIPADCPFYNDVFSMKPQVSLSSQFKSKYLIDVDGHSFSGRWRAFLESKSLGFKATIFREWHDSRLFAWRHFVPTDQRYDDLYSLLTYFVGYGKPGPERSPEDDYANGDVYIPAHDDEAKRLAEQGREWANKVLRREDIEVYTFRLLLEYARIIDDNRDMIGYSGDGSELDKLDDDSDESAFSRWGLDKLFGGMKGSPAKTEADGEGYGSRLGTGMAETDDDGATDDDGPPGGR
jgi:Glycosyl transferase family 90